MHHTLDEKIAAYAHGLALYAAVMKAGGNGLRADRKWREWSEAHPAAVEWIAAEYTAWETRL